MRLSLEVVDDEEAAARRGVQVIAADAKASIAARGRYTLAVSGGRTPWRMLALLASEPLEWRHVELFQVDERIAPDGDPARNWTHVRETLLERAPLPAANVHPMPVDPARGAAGAADYGRLLEAACGTPPVLDLVHLGLGADGHTASLVPGDPALEVRDAHVTVSGSYQGHRRMTLTFPTLDRARRLLWVVTGAEKRSALSRLLDGDGSIPAGRVHAAEGLVLADRAAAG
jgi:6-phosphogluconolactonase